VLILALETSADLCSVSLFETGESGERASYEFRHARHLSERLPAIVDFVLQDAGGLTLQNDIEAFVVGLGPGSFTGVRVAVTMAKTWAWTLNRPLVGVSSLDAVAWPYRQIPKIGIAAVTPTRRTEVVAAFYRGGNGSDMPVAPLAAPAVQANADVLSAAHRVAPDLSAWIVCGEAAKVVASAHPMGSSILWQASAPRAADIARVAESRMLRGDFDDPDSLVPLYVTPSPVG